MGFQISLCQFHKNRLSERLLEGKTVALWRELKEHKAVSQKASFQFLTEDISFFTIASMGFQISLCQFHKNSLSERLLEGKDVTLWDELTEHRVVSQKASFQFWTEDISFYTIALYGLQYITLKFHKNSLSERLLSGKDVTLWDELTEHRAVSQKASFQFLTEDIFVFHHSHLGVSKYHFENSTRRVLAKDFLRGNL